MDTPDREFIFAPDAQKIISEGHFRRKLFTLNRRIPENGLEIRILDFLRDKKYSFESDYPAAAVPDTDRKLSKIFPGLTVLINHMGRPEFTEKGINFEEYKSVLELAGLENIYIKLSGFLCFLTSGLALPASRSLRDNRPPETGFRRGAFCCSHQIFLLCWSLNTYKTKPWNCSVVITAVFSGNQLEKIYYLNAERIIFKSRLNYDC